jgi:Cu/Ag efflux pump CusA
MSDGADLTRPSSVPTGNVARESRMTGFDQQPSTSDIIAGHFLAAFAIIAVPLLLFMLLSLPTIQRLLPESLRVLPAIKFVAAISLNPRFDERDILVRWETLPGTSLPEMDRLLRRVTDELNAAPGIRGASAHVGRAISGDQIVSVNSAEIWVGIKPSADYAKAISSIREIVSGYPGVRHTIESYTNSRLGAAELSRSSKLFVRI